MAAAVFQCFFFIFFEAIATHCYFFLLGLQSASVSVRLSIRPPSVCFSFKWFVSINFRFCFSCCWFFSIFFPSHCCFSSLFMRTNFHAAIIKYFILSYALVLLDYIENIFLWNLFLLSQWLNLFVKTFLIPRLCAHTQYLYISRENFHRKMPLSVF